MSDIKVDLQPNDSVVSNTESGPKSGDTNKLRFDLISPVATRNMAKIMTMGEELHPGQDWTKYYTVPMVMQSLLRHINEFQNDPGSVDSDTQMNHAHHILCRAMMLSHLVTVGQSAIPRFAPRTEMSTY
jgi:hypothetical protein